MSAQLDLQREFAEALTGSLYTIAEKVIGDAIPAEGRLQVYANRFRAGLLDAIAATFPVTRALVGEAFFAQTARDYLIYDPPRSPILHLYGAGFPTFLAALPDLAGHHYLPDIAAFEWALNMAEHAEDMSLLRPEDLPDTDATAQLVLPLHPSAQRLSTPFPVSEIWQVHQPEAPFVDRIQLIGSGERLLVWRQGITVRWQKLDHGEDRFLAEIAGGASLGLAALAASSGSDFDFPASFSWMLDGGVFARPEDIG
ncbi:MAG: putative DNA-binding domain-containing protein [Ferrovibrio sp.]